MKPPQTPEEIRQTMTRPDDVCAAEYAEIHEFITDDLRGVWDERDTDDDARIWAISVCEEFISHATGIIEKLNRLKKFTVFIREDETPSTTFITAVAAPDQEVAANLALAECLEAWGDGYTLADLHVLGIAAGDVEILDWDDLT